MADIQTYFEKFHATIRVDYDMSSELRERRDLVLEKIRESLKKAEKPPFKELNQGSYIMKTGVKPIADLEYDIDVGLRFQVDPEEHTAAEVRSWVLDAISNHTKSVEDRRPCIRVNYSQGYHLDLVCYSVWNEDVYKLAHKTQGWRATEPKKLLAHIAEHQKWHFGDTDDSLTKTNQFRRCVRYLRRWNDVRTPFEHKDKPTGLSLVLLAMQGGLRATEFLDGRSDDLGALVGFFSSLLGKSQRLVAPKPTEEFEELLAHLSDAAMEKLQSDLGQLRDALESAQKNLDPTAACETLVPFLGTDFPVPDSKEIAKRSSGPAIISTSSSA